ncbi:hypothetical protein BpHYR1_043255 [Brachionus plicatilis]|uniref:Uncharacterized protein n=1 Tax=Brachionus plicatilis TaxID=10195 RepID=A0A3M7PAK5_BRAPC|nr:hypothetical protein BpHYR1_043255 [Brachionus plicatilis]
MIAWRLIRGALVGEQAGNWCPLVVDVWIVEPSGYERMRVGLERFFWTRVALVDQRAECVINFALQIFGLNVRSRMCFQKSCFDCGLCARESGRRAWSFRVGEKLGAQWTAGRVRHAHSQMHSVCHRDQSLFCSLKTPSFLIFSEHFLTRFLVPCKRFIRVCMDKLATTRQ